MFRRRGRWAMRRGQRRTWAHDSAGAPRPTSKVVFDTVPVKWNECERQTQSAPSPLVGEGWGGGGACGNVSAPISRPPPPPPPLPHKGEGSAPSALCCCPSSANETCAERPGPRVKRFVMPHDRAA